MSADEMFAELGIDITMQELQAINKKVEELRWMD